MAQFYDFSRLKTEANVLIFPCLEAANIACKLLMRLAGAEAIGPILMGLSRPVAVLQKGFDVEDVVRMAAIGVLGCPGISRDLLCKIEVRLLICMKLAI